MKKNLIVMFCCAAGLMSAQNLIDNPSFEEASPVNAALPAQWSSMKLLSMENHHSLDSSTAKTGKSSAKLTSKNIDGIKHFILWTQRGLGKKLFSVEGGTEMEFSAWVKTDSPDVKFRIYVEAAKTANSNYHSAVSPVQNIPGRAWKKVTVQFKLPDDKPDYYACLQLLTKGTIWFDDVYFGKASEAPVEANRVSNASMEELDGKSGLPLEWETLQFNRKGKFHSVDRTAHSGEHSLRITCSDPELKIGDFLLWIQRGLEKRLKDCLPGTEMELSIWSNTMGDPNVKYRFYIEMQKNKKYIGSFGSEALTNYVGWQKKSLRFKMPKDVPDHVYVCLQLLSPGSICFDDVSLTKVSRTAPAASVPPSGKPLSAKTSAEYGECRILHAPPRRTWFSPNFPKGLDLHLTLPPDADGKVRISLLDAQEKRLKSEEVSGRANFHFTLPKLPQGAYILRFEAGSYRDEEYFRFADAKDKDKGLRFTEDHRAYFRGKPFFPIMVMSPKMDEDAFRIYQDAGFNSVTPAYLTNDLQAGKMIADIAAKYQLLCGTWLGIGDRRQSLDDAKFKHFIQEHIRNARAMPNFFGFLDDESEMREVSPVAMKQAYKEVFLNAPDLIVWQNHAPRMTGKSGQKYGNFDNVKRFSAACDVTGVDIYPVPEGNFHSELDNKTLSCVGDFTELAAKTAYHQKPVWMVLQGCGWGEMSGGTLNERQPRPDYLQTRFMVYNAITHGARGIVMFGERGMGDVYSPYFAMMANVMKELKLISSFIAEGEEIQFKNLTLPKTVRLQAWKKQNGEIAAVIVNESKQPVVLQTPLASFSSRWHLLPEGKTVSPDTITLPMYGVAILTTKEYRIPATPCYRPQIAAKRLYTPAWTAQWTVHPNHYFSRNRTTYAKHEIHLDRAPSRAEIRITADNKFCFRIGDWEIGNGAIHLFAYRYDIAKYLKPGKNILEFELWNEDGPSGLLYEGEIDNRKILSGVDTLFSDDNKKNWSVAAKKGVPPVKPWGEVRVLQ